MNELNALSFLMLVAVGSGVCLGLAAASVEGNALHWLYKWLDRMVRRGMMSIWIAKPILLCTTCMASLWGLFTYCTAGLVLWDANLLERASCIIPYILCVAALNELISTAIVTLQVLKQSADANIGTNTSQPAPSADGAQGH
jgi:predicted PurR-regulated permease PerM